MKAMRWLPAAATVLALVLSVMLPQVVAAGGDVAGTGAGAGPDVAVTVEVPGDGPETGIDPGTLFAVRYYLQRVVENLRLLVTLDTTGDAALLAEFAEARADTLAELDPQSEWYDRLAADIATLLRLAQDRVVQARVDGEPADAAVAVLREVVQRLEELVAELDEALAGRQDEAAGETGDNGGAGGDTPGDEEAAGEEGEEVGDSLRDALEAAEEARVVVDVVPLIDPAVVRELRVRGYGYGQIALMHAAARRISEKTGEAVTVRQVADLVDQAGGDGGGRHAFGRNLRVMLAGYGIERNELKPGRLVKMIRPGAGEDRQEGDGDDSTGASSEDEAGDEDGRFEASDREDESGDKDAVRAGERGRGQVEVRSKAKAKAGVKVKVRTGARDDRWDDGQETPAVRAGRDGGDGDDGDDRDDEGEDREDDDADRRMHPRDRDRHRGTPGDHRQDDKDDDD